MYSVPILFLVFNRPDNASTVFNRIREVKPKYLYVAADGAREYKVGEQEACLQTRAIINQIDWPCELKTLYREQNLGCKRAVSEAISWFFEDEEYGIILEDDCLPDLSFFPFCEELLIKYRNDERIGHIGGNCFLPGIVKDGMSYDFCSITHVWGWATWRRVWEKVNVDFPFWKESEEKRSWLFYNKWEEIYFSSFISDSLSNRHGLNPWAVFYYFSLRLQHQLSIYPSVNLVTNIGLGDVNATHTVKQNHVLYVPSSPMTFPLKHPTYVLNNHLINTKDIFKHFFSYKRLMRYIFRHF
ncbi:MAG: hypothetical protein LUH63_14745 [Parabacteroides sp.]|nr:hypothetical protein [Parabacteroides sp.]